jgi:hypothetical protein
MAIIRPCFLVVVVLVLLSKSRRDVLIGMVLVCSDE